MQRWMLGLAVLLTGCAPAYTVKLPESPMRVLSVPDTLGSPLVVMTDSMLALMNPPLDASDQPQWLETTAPEPDAFIDRVVSPAGIPYRVIARRRMVMTAYNSDPRQTDGTPWIGASGRLMVPLDAACNGLPIGTRFRIPEVFGWNIFTVEDRMAENKGFDHVDVWVYHIRDAYALGHPVVTVEILGPPLNFAPP